MKDNSQKKTCRQDKQGLGKAEKMRLGVEQANDMNFLCNEQIETAGKAKEVSVALKGGQPACGLLVESDCLMTRCLSVQRLYMLSTFTTPFNSHHL